MLTGKRKMISQTVSDGLCTGCGTCMGVCPNKAIIMSLKESNGIYVPKIYINRCASCGLCYDTCPGHRVDFTQLDIEAFGQTSNDVLFGNCLNYYSGYSLNPKIRYNSSSGGLITQVLMYLLESGMIHGALVTRMNNDNPLEPEPFIARTKEEILGAATSKYCPVPTNILIKDILMSPKEEKFAIVGLPCHIQGIRKAETVIKTLRQKIFLHLGIFCGGNISFLGTEYLFRRLNVPMDDVLMIKYRGQGWPGKLLIKLKNNNILNYPYPEYWGNFGSFFHPARCKLCCDWSSELADISFADFWHPEVKKSDKVGTSLIISRSSIGDNILYNMTTNNKIDLRTVYRDDVLGAQQGIYWKKRDANSRIKLLKLLGKEVPHYDRKLLKPKNSSYANALLTLPLEYLAANKDLWRYFDMCLRYKEHLK